VRITANPNPVPMRSFAGSIAIKYRARLHFEIRRQLYRRPQLTTRSRARSFSTSHMSWSRRRCDDDHPRAHHTLRRAATCSALVTHQPRSDVCPR
jgi:hypothetical protein